MSTATRTRRRHGQRNGSVVQTKVTLYERASGLLISLLILIGFFVLLLFFLWLTKMMSPRQRSVPVTIVEELAGRGDHALGVARDLEEPGVEELADVLEPQITESLAAVTDAISSQAATLEQFQGDAVQMGTGSGLGDSRAVGPGGEGDGGAIPRWQRWEVRFSTNSKTEYTQQLDFFRIELGAIGGSPEVDYLSKLSQANPQQRSGPPGEEKRLYFSYTGKNALLKEWDRQLLEGAGIRTAGRQWLQFVPKDVEDQLAVLELANAGGRTVFEIEKTIFGVRAVDSGYVFFVSDQRFRRVP